MKLLTPNHYPVNREGLIRWHSYRNSGDVGSNGAWRGYPPAVNRIYLLGGAFVGSDGMELSGGYGDIDAFVLSIVGYKDFTVSIWLKPTALTGNRTIFEFGTYAQGILLRATPEGSFYVNGVTYNWEPGKHLRKDTWSMVTLTRKNRAFNFYVNGALVKSIQNNVSITFASTWNFFFGARTDKTEHFAGYMDDIQVFSRAVSAGEIQMNYERTRRDREFKGLVGWWSSAQSGDVPALGTWEDASGNGNDGTLKGAATVDSQGMLCTIAEGDYLSIPSSTDFGFGTADFSITAWIKPAKECPSACIFDIGGYVAGMATFIHRADGYSVYMLGYGHSFSTSSIYTIKPSIWTMMTFVRNNGNIKVYVNDYPYMESTSAGNMGTAPSILIGAVREDLSSEYTGYIDDIQVYNRALTDTEVGIRYERTKRVPFDIKTLNPTIVLDADTLTGVTGDKVATWADSSGYGHDVTQPTVTAQPILKAGIDGINGHNAIDRDGAVRWFQRNYFVNDCIQQTWIAVFQPESATASQVIFDWGYDSWIFASTYVSMNGIQELFVPSTTKANIVMCDAKQNGTYNLWLNNELIASRAVGAMYINSEVTLTGLTYSQEAGYPFDGKVSYMATLPIQLSPKDRNRLYEELATRYLT